MGQSTNAILAFGINLGAEEDGTIPEALVTACGGEDDFDFEELILADAGLKAPGHHNYDAPEWDDYWAAKKEAVAAYPVTLEYHCSGEYPMYFLAVNGTVVTARRGYPEVVQPTTVAPQQVQALRDFCERFGIECGEPKWHLFSYWN
jgi:hypothetical protein